MKSFNKNNSHRGFNLLEMMLVISISAIILAFAVPQFTKTIEQERARKNHVDMKILNSAVKVYLAKYRPGATEIDGIRDLNNTLGINIYEGTYGDATFEIIPSQEYTHQDTGDLTTAPESYQLRLYPPPNADETFAYYYYYTSYDYVTCGPVGPICVPVAGSCPTSL